MSNKLEALREAYKLETDTLRMLSEPTGVFSSSYVAHINIHKSQMRLNFLAEQIANFNEDNPTQEQHGE